MTRRPQAETFMSSVKCGRMKYKGVVRLQPSPQAFSVRSFLDSTMSCDVTERYSPALSQTSRGQRIKTERLGTRLVRLEKSVCRIDSFQDVKERL